MPQTPHIERHVTGSATVRDIVTGASPVRTFTATVTAVAPGSGTPTGTVSLSDGSNMIGQVTLNGAGQATFTHFRPVRGSPQHRCAVCWRRQVQRESTDFLSQNVAWASQR
jgi:hypothetical protein